MRDGKFEYHDNVRRRADPYGPLGLIEAVTGEIVLVRWSTGGDPEPVSSWELEFVPGREWTSQAP
jgi:hypothetical protein